MCSKKSGLLSGSAAFAAMGIAGVVHGQVVVYVDQTNPTPGNGSSWAESFSDLQAAFNSINSKPMELVRSQPVEFRIAQGTYRPPQARGAAFYSGTRTTGSASVLTIRGSFGGRSSATPDAQDFVSTATVLSADVLGDDGPQFSNRTDNCASVLSFGAQNGYFPHPPVTMEGLQLRGGDRWGALLVGTYWYIYPSVAVVMRDCAVVDNRSENNGGGIVNEMRSSDLGPGLTMIRCTIAGNHADRRGGGLFVAPESTVEVTGCVFRNNTALLEGGGIATEGILGVRTSTIAGNTSDGEGGGLFKGGTNFDWGVFSCLIVGNHSASNGGGMAGAGLNLTACTIADNSASWGGGMFIRDWSGTRFCLFFRNSATNQGHQIAGPAGPSYHNLTHIGGDPNALFFPFSNEPVDYVTQLIPSTPTLVNPNGPDGDSSTWHDNNYRLAPRTIGIDLDPTIWAYNTDLDGNDRFVPGIVGRPPALDLGCYESQLTLCPTDIDADQGVTIDDLLDFLAAFELGQPLADLTTNGSTPFPDGGVTVDDLLFFLAKFEQGC